MSTPELPQWVTSMYESTWHVPLSGGGSLQAVCGHRVRGPVHARRDTFTPTTSEHGRSLCQACMIATFGELPTRRRVSLDAALRAGDRPSPASGDEPPGAAWPHFDADQLLPGNRRLAPAA